MRNILFALVLAWSVLSIHPASALEGLSPVWELYYNNQPFSAENPAHQPSADPDGDGFSNAQESAAGTNPFSGLPPDGFPQLRIGPHPWLSNRLALTFPGSQTGKNYLYSHSTTLQPGSWNPFPEAFPGTGGELLTPVEATTSGGAPIGRVFFKAVISDQPNPGGIYTPWDLHILSLRPDIAAALQPNVPGGGNGSGGNGGGTPIDPNSDGAGPSDRYDAAPNDNIVNWQKTPEAKYLWIPAGYPKTGGYTAVDSNDRGQILFRHNIPISNFATDPVAKIWDPSVTANEGFIDVFFQPSDFRISLLKARTPSEAEPSPPPVLAYESAPMPDPGNANLSVSLSVDVRRLGPDGSVLANVAYGFGEYGGHRENVVRSGGGKFVFLWKAGVYGTCRILGDSPGFQGDTNVVSENWSTGFYTDTTDGNAPIVRAILTQQNNLLDNIYAETALRILAPDVIDLAPPASPLTGEPSRPVRFYPNPRATPSGRVLITNLITVDSTQHSLCGTVPHKALPPGAIIHTITDLPPQAGPKCAFGRIGGDFQLWDGDALVTTTIAHSLLQLDRHGTGISDGYKPEQQIWRNGFWYTLATATGLPGNNFTGLNPKKISENGIIWVSNADGTNNGILIPVDLTQQNMPNVGLLENSTDVGNLYESAHISENQIAYITGQPQVPQLRAKLRGMPSSMTVEWRLEIHSERTQRGTLDDRSFPAAGFLTLPGDQEWNITNTMNSEFVGGQCTLSYRAGAASGTMPFYIRGKNPMDNAARARFDTAIDAPFVAYAWGMAKHESRFGPRAFNQFNAGVTNGTPFYGEPNGWGMCQIDRPVGNPGVTTAEVWNWHTNVTAMNAKLVEKQAVYNRFIGYFRDSYGTNANWSEPPAAHTIGNTTLPAEAWGVMVFYNGTGGVPTSTTPTHPSPPFASPWKFNPTTGVWTFNDNQNNYASGRVRPEIEGTVNTQE